MTGATGDAPLVSVVMPCYNLGEYLDEAVDSVLAQTYPHFEILIVDDGSTDDATRALLAAYVRPRTRILHSTNRGLPAARNLGLAHTSGPYVCMLDPDDRIEPTLFEKSLKVLEEDPSIAFVSHWLRTFGDEAWEWTPARCDFPTLLDMNSVNGAAIARRGALEQVGGFDETMLQGCEDWDLWISLVEHGFRGVILPEFLFGYRRRHGSMSRVMLEGDTHPRLYRRLVEKHSASYREHLVDLLTRRDREIVGFARQIADLEIEMPQWLTPELAQRRDDIALLERKVEIGVRQSQVATMASLVKERDQLIVEGTAWADGLALAVRTAHDLDARANRAEAELRGLRESMSWRLTRPLRVLDDVRRRLMRRRS